MARKSARRKGHGLGDRNPEQLRKFWKPPRGAKLGGTPSAHAADLKETTRDMRANLKEAVHYAKQGRCGRAQMALLDAAMLMGEASVHAAHSNATNTTFREDFRRGRDTLLKLCKR